MPQPSILFSAWWLILVCLGLVFGPLGCGSRDNYLEGSIAKRFDLDFDIVRAKQTETGFVITYLDHVHFRTMAYHADNTTLELMVNSFPDPSQLRKWLDITRYVKVNRYVIIQVDANQLAQDERRFPDVKSAQIVHIDLGQAPSELLSGQFRIIFVDGTTLRGGYSAEIQ